MNTQQRKLSLFSIVAAAAGLLAVAFGIRAVLGLFISPLNTSTGLGFATISLALAVSQLAGGIAQPLWGAAADRHGPAPVIVAGIVLLAFGLASLAIARSPLMLGLAFCLIMTACAAVGSTPALLGAIARLVPEPHRGLASGLVSAGGSVGQLVFAPVAQLGIAAFGGLRTLFGLALVSLAVLPMSRAFKRAQHTEGVSNAESAKPDGGTRAALRSACGSPTYWLICAGFAVCGFHVSFMLAHMPGVIELCGLPTQLTGVWLGVLGLSNVASSILSGLALKRFAAARVLSLVYALRASGVALYLLAPKTQTVMLGFALWMGITYMGTLAPTSTLVGKLYGTRYIGTLFGVVMLVHQLGSFFGVWLGGVALEISGSYQWVWCADLVLAVSAALIHLFIRESHQKEQARAAVRPSAQSA